MTKVIRLLVARAHAHLYHAKKLQKVYADKKKREVNYEVGDKVWVATCFILGNHNCTKFTPCFCRPFEILEKVGKVANKVDLPPTYLCHNVFHVSQLSNHSKREAEM